METAAKKPRSKRTARKSPPPSVPPSSARRPRKRQAPAPTPPAPPSPHNPCASQKPVFTQPVQPNVNPSSSSSLQQQATLSRSTLLRSQGNVLYKQASEGGFCFTIKRAKILRALQMYMQALNASDSNDESASCYKNLGMLHWLSCKFELNQQLLLSEESHGSSVISIKHLSVCKIFLFDSIRMLFKALEHGENCKPKPWIDQLQHVFNSIVEWATDQSSLLSMPHSPLLQYLCEAFEDASPVVSYACLLAYKNHADALFKEALARRLPDMSMDYKGCHSLLHDCCLSLRKGTSSSGLTQEVKVLQQEMRGLQESVNVHICICEAMQAITLGDVSLSEALLDEEEMDMEKVKDALDYYRQASLATRELDMETEAIAMSRIGKVYSDVLKVHEAAHKFHFQSTRLALTVMSPSIARAEWYKYSSEKVKEHQEKVLAEEREHHEKDREPVMQRLKEKLSALSKEAKYSAESFLQYVYTAHPHPDMKRNVVPLLGDSTKVRASLKKALLHYHPDSNMQYGKDWMVLCEEICKHLNEKYACFKGV